MAPVTAAASLLTLFPGMTTNSFILNPSAFTAKHTVMRYFPCPVKSMGMVFDPRCSTVVSRGISAQIGVSSMLAMHPREKLNLLLCFSQNFTKFAIFCRTSLA